MADGDGVVVGINIYPDLLNLCISNPIYDTISGTSAGNHAICLVGYDDELKVFKFINSQGLNWELDGYGWISYNLLCDTRINQYGIAIGYVIENPIVYESHFDYDIYITMKRL